MPGGLPSPAASRAVPEVSPQAPSHAIEQSLYEIFSRHSHRKIGPAERDELFSSLGVDSLRAVKIAGEIQNHLKIKLPATLLFECPNLKSLIRELERRLS